MVSGVGTAITALVKVYVEDCVRSGECDSELPILNTGGDIPEHSWHIADSQIGEGSNGRSTAKFLNYGPRTPVDYNATGHCDKYARTEYGEQAVCDEYPFATTAQGGQLNYDNGKVSLRLLPISEMSLQRDLLRDFYRDARLSPDGSSKLSKFISVGMPTLPSGYSLRDGTWRKWR